MMGVDSCNFDYKFNQLQHYIKETYSVESYSDLFSSLTKHHEKVGMAHCLLTEANLLQDQIEIHPKSCKESHLFREKGNKEFLQKQDLLAIQTYSVSAAFAPVGSEELALAFANRSAVTFSIKEYKPCLEDINRALAGKYPEPLRYKLYERKGKCLKFLGLNNSAKDVFQLALNYLSSSQLCEEKLTSTSSSIAKLLNSCSGDDICYVADNKCIPCISGTKNDVILSASSLVQIEYTPELGRHLIATETIEPGDVLIVEEPFASVLLPASYNTYCFHCKKRSHALIPCIYCVVAMYCSEACRSTSWDENHRVECKLVPLLVAYDFTKIELIAVRTVIMATKQNKLLHELMETIPQVESSTHPKDRGFDGNGCYNSRDYRSVHHLIGNMELRSNADIFRRAVIAAFILHLMDKNTDFFSSDIHQNEEEEDINGKQLRIVQLHSSVKLFVGGLLFRYLMIVPSNAHEVSEMVLKKVKGGVDCESVEIGGAMYPALSLINHSCDPNIVRHSHNGDLNVVTAIQVIAAGEQIFDNYGYHHAMHDVSTRQSKLWSQYHFRCQCRACRDDWPIYSQLPNTDPTYLNFRLKDEADKSSEIFQEVLSEIKSGDMERKLLFLYAHLSLLHRTIQRPWKEYSECQEAIKQCLSYQANHYFAC